MQCPPPPPRSREHRATFLETRKKQFGKKMRQLMPHRPGQEVADALCLVGQDLFRWARETSAFGQTQKDADDSDLNSVADGYVDQVSDPTDTDGDGRPDNPDAADLFDADGDGDYDGPLSDGPSFEVGIMDDSGAITQRSTVGKSADGGTRPLRVLLKAVQGQVRWGRWND